MLYLVAPVLALAGGMLIPVLKFKSRKVRFIYSMILSLAVSACAVVGCFVADPQPVVLLSMAEGFALAFKADGLSKVFVALVCFLWPLAVSYATEYMRYEEREDSFFLWYIIVFGVTLLVAYSGNLFTMYVTYELLSLSTVPLVVHKMDKQSVHAGLKYMVYTIGGAALGFAAMLMFARFASMDWFQLGGTLFQGQGTDAYGLVVFLLMFLGFGVKAAVFPLHDWLPSASVAPTPVTALLHAVAVVKAGAFACMRVVYYCFGAEALYGTWAQDVCICLAAFSLLFGAVKAVRTPHLKLRLAYSTVSNLNYVLFAVCLMTPDGFASSLTHMLFHGVMKITLFFCVGAMMVIGRRKYMHDVYGLSRRMPLTAAAFTVAAVALTGIPPFAGFISKFSILSAAVFDGGPFAIGGAVCLVAASVLCALYMAIPVCSLYFFKSDSSTFAPGEDPAHDPSPLMTVPFAILCVAIIALGVWSGPVTSFLNCVAQGLV